MLSYKNGSENNRQQEGAETRKAKSQDAYSVQEFNGKKKVKKAKATPGLPMWSPTIVLTGLDRA